MPSAVIGAFVSVVTYVSTAYATAVALGGVYALAAHLAVGALLSTLSSKLFGPKAPPGAGLSGLQIMTRSALEHRKIVYGQAMVSGPVYYNNTSGTNNEYLWYGVALCDGLSEGLIYVWLDGNPIPYTQIDWTAGTGASDGTGTGDVSTAKWIGDNSTKAVQIFYYLGDDAQPVSGDLNTAFADIGTNHRLRGVTHVICKFLMDTDTEAVWKSGHPGNIKAIVKGRKLYDPRLDTTQIINTTTSPYTYGSSTHRTTDSTTWVWSENPALCVADYMLNVMGVAATSINWESIANAADDCEVLVAISTTSPETTETRFTCNGALSMGSTHKDNLDSILSAMNGQLSYSAGTWKLRAGVWEASSVSIDADDLAGEIQVRGSAPKSERFNGVRGFFIDPIRNYESVEFPHITESTYVTRDNGKTILYDLQLPMTNTPTMAQRIAYRNLGQGNNQIICKLKMNARGSKIAVGDVVSFTLDSLSWSSKTFRCIEWNRNSDGTFDVTLREDDSTDYDDPAGSAYGIAGTGGVTIPAQVIPPPTGLTATAGVGGILLNWTNPAITVHDYIDVYEDTDSGWAGATRIASLRSDSYFVPRATGTTYYYWVRAVKAPDLESLRSPDSDTSTVSAAATGGSDGYNAATLTAYKRSAADPGDDPGASITYTFATADWTPGNGWSKTIPAVGSPTLSVWAVAATAYSQSTTDDVLSADWSAPAQILQDGSDGSAGLNVSAVYIYQRTLTDSAPVSNPADGSEYTFATGGLTFTTANGWTATVPSQTSPTSPFLWTTLATASSTGATDTILNSEWQTPQKLAEDGTDGTDGSAGSDGVYTYLTNEAHTLAANFDGTGYDLAGSGGTHKTFDGLVDVTTTALHSIDGGTDGNLSSPQTGNWTKVQNGLTMTMVEATGVYSLSGASWTTVQETFTLQSQYQGVDYDKVYTITKARGGIDGACGIMTWNSISEEDTTSTATVGFTVDSDGDVYTRANDAASYVSQYTWINVCANTAYEVRLSKTTGDDPTHTGTGTGAGLAQWLACSSDQKWEWSATTTPESFAGTVEIRRTSDDTVLGTTTVNMACLEEDTLKLTTLSSSDSDDDAPYSSTAGMRVRTNGNVQELISDFWTNQSSSTQWINQFTTTSTSDYEVNLSNVSGGSLTGPGYDAGAATTWHTISTDRQWTLFRGTVGTTTVTGTMTIREIADTGNSTSASFTLECVNTA